MAQVGVLDEKRYGRLLGKHRPRLIQHDEEFDRLSAELESLDAIEESRELDAEEHELQALLAQLCTEYEDRTVPPPVATPLEVVRFLMDQNGLRPVDLVDVFGSRAVTSQVLSGKREISKAHARRLSTASACQSRHSSRRFPVRPPRQAPPPWPGSEAPVRESRQYEPLSEVVEPRRSALFTQWRRHFRAEGPVCVKPAQPSCVITGSRRSALDLRRWEIG